MSVKSYLMHQEKPVLEIFLNEGQIEATGKLLNSEHLPIGVCANRDGYVDPKDFAYWWFRRAIPSTRQELSKAFKELQVMNVPQILSYGLGLSLSDQYWMKPVESQVCWSDVNFFDHDFSERLGLVLIGELKNLEKRLEPFEFNSPDSATNGDVKKRWCILDGQRYLLKSGTGPFKFEPFNEAIASDILDVLNVPHVGYRVLMKNLFTDRIPPPL